MRLVIGPCLCCLSDQSPVTHRFPLKRRLTARCQSSLTWLCWHRLMQFVRRHDHRSAGRDRCGRSNSWRMCNGYYIAGQTAEADWNARSCTSMTRRHTHDRSACIAFHQRSPGQNRVKDRVLHGGGEGGSATATRMLFAPVTIPPAATGRDELTDHSHKANAQ